MDATERRMPPGPSPAAVMGMATTALTERWAVPARASAAAAPRRRPQTSSEQVRVERELGRRLLYMKRLEGFRTLGYVRMRDYAAERLGLTQRTAQELMRAAEALDALPILAAALERGEITWGHVRVLTRVTTPADEAVWVDLAKRRSVRQLAKDVAVTRAGADKAAPDAGPGSSGSREGMTTAAAAAMIDPEARLEWVEISSTAWIASMWREVKVIIRRIVESALPAGACLGTLLAESAAGLLDGSAVRDEAPGGLASLARHEASEDGRGETTDGDATHGPVAECGAGSAASKSSSSAPAESRAGDAPSSDLDARALDAEMRELVTARQRQEAALADTLAECHRWRAFRACGYESLEEFALERHGLSARKFYYMMALHRELDRLPLLRKAFVSGRLTLRRALRVAAVSTPRTVEAWIRRAESVKLRRLEDEIEFWQHLRDTRDAVWRLLQGRPLPEGIVLVPGLVPRLRSDVAAERDLHAFSRAEVADDASAAVEAGSGNPDPEPGDDLHAFSRAEVPNASPEAADSGSGQRSPELGSNLHPFSFVSVPSARAFLAALEADEALTPLPERRCRIRILVEPDVGRPWMDSVAALRAKVRPELEECEALALLMREFLLVWDNKETRRQARQHPTLERDGWRCSAPGCTSVGSGKLHEHHITFRSAGGALRASSNVTTLCAGHHLGLLHHGIVRVRGRAPDELIWEMGVEPACPERGAFLVYAGDRLTRDGTCIRA